MVVAVCNRRLPNAFDPLAAGCVAIYDSLKFAKERGFHVTRVESDSLMAIHAIHGLNAPLTLDSLLSDINVLLLELRDGSCHDVQIIQNVVAHALARESFSLVNDMFWLYVLLVALLLMQLFIE